VNEQQLQGALRKILFLAVTAQSRHSDVGALLREIEETARLVRVTGIARQYAADVIAAMNQHEANASSAGRLPREGGQNASVQDQDET
jgi:hypothetical protein